MNLTTGYTNPIFEMIGYEPKTTFWTDFSIVEFPALRKVDRELYLLF